MGEGGNPLSGALFFARRKAAHRLQFIGQKHIREKIFVKQAQEIEN
jgi:hypothetical protein